MNYLHRIILAIKRFYSPAYCTCGGKLENYHNSGYLWCDKCGQIE